MLTEQQKALKLTEEQNVLCLASAGSGKSHVVVHRITHLIKDKNVDPERIYLFSFSRTATREIREKLEEALGYDVFAKLTVSTFHAYAYKIVMENSNHFNLDDSKMKIIDNRGVEGLLKYTGHVMYDREQIMFKLTRNDIELMMEAYIESRHYGRVLDLPSDLNMVLTDAINYMKRKHLITFNDLLEMTKILFRAKPGIAEEYAAQFDHLILDESQDTSLYVFEILDLLMNKNHHFMAVGDIQQNLYGFTGCDPENLIAFAESRNCIIMHLNRTFRFGPTVSEVANRVVDDLDIEDEYKITTETDQTSQEVSYAMLGSNDGEKEIIPELYALELVEKWHKAGVKYKDMYILARTNKELTLYSDFFLQADIPVINRGEGMMKRREVRHMMNALALVRNNNREDWIEFVKPYPVGLNSKLVNLVFHDFDGTLEEMQEMLLSTTIQGIGPKRKSEFNKLIDNLLAVKAEIRRTDLRDFRKMGEIIDIGSTDFMVTAAMTTEGNSVAEERWDHLDFLTNMAKRFTGDILAFPEYMKTLFDAEGAKRNAVTLMTIHKSKGMTLPYVILDTKKFFSFANTEKEILWEKFCLYVGITRAKHKLVYLFSPENPAAYYIPEDLKTSHPSDVGEFTVGDMPPQASNVLSELASLSLGSGYRRSINPTKVVRSSEKAVLIEMGNKNWWMPRKSFSVDLAQEKVMVADWLANQNGWR